MNQKSAIAAINQAGALLVFPMDNRKEPASIWSHFFPRTPMRWEWDESGDNRVGDLWQLRGALSTTGKVVYTKWFRGRATYFSKDVFANLLRALNPTHPYEGLTTQARALLKILEEESPLSTKEIKRQADLKGREAEKVYDRAMKELWARMLIVAYGEVDDGAFPSLAVGATRVIYEDLWRQAMKADASESETALRKRFDPKNLFYRHYLKQKKVRPASQKKPGSEKATPSVIWYSDIH